VVFIVLTKGVFMQFALKLALSIAIIIVCTQIGKKFPTLGGLIATMPLTGVIVLVWLYSYDPSNLSLLEGYTKGALWGIGPTILFFLSAYICFHLHCSLALVLTVSFSIWFVGACFHQFLLR
jgi:hypothetical protein